MKVGDLVEAIAYEQKYGIVIKVDKKMYKVQWDNPKHNRTSWYTLAQIRRVV